MRRRPGQLLVSALTATLALVTVGWAATGQLPLVSERAAPSAVTAQATGPLVANDHEGRAVLTAEGMAPGAVRTGEVTIGNAGDGAGAFTLSADAAPGSAPGGGGLSGVLDLRVLDVSGAEAATVYAGTVRALHRVALGTLAAHEMRRYRFELRFPAGRAAAIDDVHQGASTTVTFTWDAAATGARPLPAPDSAPEPAPVAPAPAAPAP
ncbi:MAG: hypothetical protein QOC64_636, partial [Solirubrobacteraceae bacterium]|nr:hypothetical protein [Solirubrobacteraceae bacterium]